MNKNGLVSVIINCHNAEKYISKSIISVLKQTYKNFEIILFDNKSTDRTRKIVNNFHSKKIRYFYCKRYLKLGAARNLAIEKARGKYVAFLDSDDTWYKDKIKKQIKFLKKNNLKICFSNYFNFYEKKKRKIKAIKKKLKKISTQSLIDCYSIGILTVLMEKSLLRYKKFSEKLNIIEDFDFFINLSLKEKFGYLNNALAVYRIHDGNFSHKKKIYLKELKNWIKKNEMIFLKKNIKMKKLKIQLIKLEIKKIFNFSLI